MFGSNGIIQQDQSRKAEATHEAAVEIHEKSPKGHRISMQQAEAQARAQAAVQAPAERIVLVPVVEDNGHGVQVTVYRKYRYKN